MAVESKRMQQRYGTYTQFQADILNLLPHEFVSVSANDPNTSDGKALYYQPDSGSPKRILTSSDIQNLYKIDITTTNPDYLQASPYTIYLAAQVDNEKGIIITGYDKSYQVFLGTSRVLYRQYTGGSSYSAWVCYGRGRITNADKTRADLIPSIKAVVDYVTDIKEALDTAIGDKENSSNKKTSMPSNPTDTQYLSALAVKTFVENKGYLVAQDIEGKENSSNKVTALSQSSTNSQYPSAKCVYDTTKDNVHFINITGSVSISDMNDLVDQDKVYHFLCSDSSIDEECTLRFIWSGEEATSPGGTTVYPNSTQILITGSGRVLKRTSDEDGVWGTFVEMESTSNKIAVINPNTATNDQYPSALAVVNYVNSVVNN